MILIDLRSSDEIICRQGRRQVKKCGVDMHGERVEHESIMGAEPQRGPGAEPLVRKAKQTDPNLLLASKNSSDLHQSQE